MQLAVGETTYPVMGGIKWHKTYHAQLATPLSARDVVNAHLVFVLARVASACAVFMLVLAPFGVFESWWGPILAFFVRSEEHTSELQSLMRISYAVFCFKKTKI